MEVFDLNSLSSVLDLSREEIVKLLEEGEISGRKYGGEWKVSERQLREFLEEDNIEKIPSRFL